MSTNLGKMTGQAVLDVKAWDGGLAKMTTDAKQAKSRIDSTFGRNISLIGGLVGFDKLKGAFFQSVARLNQEIAQRDQAQSPLTQLQQDFRGAQELFHSLAQDMDSITAKIVIGWAKIIERVREVTGLGPTGFISTVEPAEIADRRRRAQLMERQQFNLMFALGASGRGLSPGQAASALQEHAQSRTGLTADELNARSVQREQARSQLIHGLQNEFATLRMNAEELQRHNLLMLGANEIQIQAAEAVRRRLEAEREAQAWRDAQLTNMAAEMERTRQFAEQARTPLQNFQRELRRIGEAGLDASQRARLGANALRALLGSIGQTPALGGLDFGSAEAAGVLNDRGRPGLDVVGTLRAIAAEEQRQREEDRRIFEEIRDTLRADGNLLGPLS